MNTPSVTFLVPDIAAPVLGPVTMLAHHLENHFPVDIVGPDFGAGVSPMYQGNFDYTTVPTPRMYRVPDYFRESRRLGQAVTGDVVVAVKAFGSTLPVALREKRRRGAKVILYLDEWDAAVYRQLPVSERARRWIFHAHHPLNEIYFPYYERMVGSVDRVISTSSFLQNRFGGNVVHVGVNVGRFRPPPSAEVDALKKELGLEGCRVIVFGGVVRPHKGCEVVLEAMARMGSPDVRFLVVGPETEHLKSLQSNPRFSSQILTTGTRPSEEMPRYLALADLIALPLANNLLSQSQVPCKVFEAMAMARPIVASDVSDLPRILEGCGWVVPPGDAAAMADAITEVLGNEDEARARGLAAREKCERLYQDTVTERQLVEIVNDVYQNKEFGVVTPTA